MSGTTLSTTQTIRLPALKLVESSRAASRLANALLVLLVACILGMLFLPWQQSARHRQGGGLCAPRTTANYHVPSERNRVTHW